MAYISFQPSDYFNTKLYSGTDSSNAITGVGFQPDWVWIKNRSGVASHALMDAVRGNDKSLRSNTTGAEYTNTYFTSFDTDGFTLTSSETDVNASSTNYASWNWKASNATAVSNTDGSITSSVSASTTSGFSVVTYTGAGSTSTVGHGLGVAPKVVLIKGRSNTGTWGMYHSSIGETKKIILNSTAGEATSGFMNNTAPTSSVFTVINDADVGSSGYTYVAYCFAEKKGFSKFSSHVGNGSTDGAFIYTGFKPAWFLLKPSSGTGQWFVWDSTRSPINQAQKILSPESSAAEGDSSGAAVDFVSNGIKIRNNDGGINQSGVTYITMAFASEPLVSSNDIPATAR